MDKHKNNHIPLTMALGTGLALTIATTPVATAESGNPFAATKLSQGYLLAEHSNNNAQSGEKEADGKCGTGKCGAGKCGTGQCGADKETNVDSDCPDADKKATDGTSTDIKTPDVKNGKDD